MEDIQFKEQQKRNELIERWYSLHPVENSLLSLHGIINHREMKKLMLYFCIITYFYPWVLVIGFASKHLHAQFY